MTMHYPFILAPLPFPFHGLKPYIDTETVEIHYTKHHQVYVNNLNNILAKYPHYHDWSLEKLITHLNALPQEIRQCVRDNAGGVFNHNLYWDSMSPCGGGNPIGRLNMAIDQRFGSYAAFCQIFTSIAQNVFGSGYIWLVTDAANGLDIVTTANQDTPLTPRSTPILALDLWEHSYYLKYRNLRADYIKNWWCLIDWPFAEERYNILKATC